MTPQTRLFRLKFMRPPYLASLRRHPLAIQSNSPGTEASLSFGPCGSYNGVGQYADMSQSAACICTTTPFQRFHDSSTTDTVHPPAVPSNSAALPQSPPIHPEHPTKPLLHHNCPANTTSRFFKLCTTKHKTCTQPKSESRTAPYQRHRVVMANCPTTCHVKYIRSLQQNKAKEVEHNSIPLVGAAPSVKLDAMTSPADCRLMIIDLCANPRTLVGQAGRSPSLLSNNSGFHYHCLGTAVTSRSNHSIKAYRSGVCQM